MFTYPLDLLCFPLKERRREEKGWSWRVPEAVLKSEGIPSKRDTKCDGFCNVLMIEGKRRREDLRMIQRLVATSTISCN